MPNHDRDPQVANDPHDPLALTKETLGDLDLEPGDADAVKGGALPTTLVCISTSKAAQVGEIR
jgi:hypothetical protein